ncbi:MAG TPA: hypothetical protein PLZ57_15050 [Pseudobdellovibrionaceae bacterium]|nr:hypothetical protein [Pseudobdellovibrionaceae bacterium]
MANKESTTRSGFDFTGFQASTFESGAQLFRELTAQQLRVQQALTEQTLSLARQAVTTASAQVQENLKLQQAVILAGIGMVDDLRKLAQTHVAN